MSVCNIGIGTGDWDDFLGYELNGYGHLTSIDIDREICDLFQYRQLREGHNNPSEVVCCDFLSNSIDDKSFDLITIIGSTMNQIGNYGET
ncbi:class I SAM-dependent methyltransferase [Cohnella sp. CFH 77786]|uniref:class I SAM-dependent methyltransferase n=1 Tax=Cohnella sp. CFH 77786 TaxID=2662265 RepID=UPI00351D7060